MTVTGLMPSGPPVLSSSQSCPQRGGMAHHPVCLSPLEGAGVVGVCLGGYLIETTGSWTSVFNLVAAIGSLGLCTFLVFGKAQRVDLSPAREDL